MLFALAKAKKLGRNLSMVRVKTNLGPSDLSPDELAEGVGENFSFISAYKRPYTLSFGTTYARGFRFELRVGPHDSAPLYSSRLTNRTKVGQAFQIFENEGASEKLISFLKLKELTNVTFPKVFSSQKENRTTAQRQTEGQHEPDATASEEAYRSAEAIFKHSSQQPDLEDQAKYEFRHTEHHEIPSENASEIVSGDFDAFINRVHQNYTKGWWFLSIGFTSYVVLGRAFESIHSDILLGQTVDLSSSLLGALFAAALLIPICHLIAIPVLHLCIIWFGGQGRYRESATIFSVSSFILIIPALLQIWAILPNPDMRLSSNFLENWYDLINISSLGTAAIVLPYCIMRLHRVSFENAYFAVLAYAFFPPLVLYFLVKMFSG
jgi:hypothetical protein